MSHPRKRKLEEEEEQNRMKQMRFYNTFELMKNALYQAMYTFFIASIETSVQPNIDVFAESCQHAFRSASRHFKQLQNYLLMKKIHNSAFQTLFSELGKQMLRQLQTSEVELNSNELANCSCSLSLKVWWKTLENKETQTEKLISLDSSQDVLVFFIGRYSFCDIELKLHTMSRLACVVFVFPKIRRIYVTDFTSAIGFVSKNSSRLSDPQYFGNRLVRKLLAYEWDDKIEVSFENVNLFRINIDIVPS